MTIRFIIQNPDFNYTEFGVIEKSYYGGFATIKKLSNDKK